jgi:hypothetical protein
MAFAAALSGVKNYYINGKDPEALSFAAGYIAKAGLRVRIVPGDIMNISLDGSYNVFLCREMLRHFLSMSPEGYMGVFLRPMRSYFVETIVSYNEDHDMYSNLLRAGCTMEVIRPVPEGQASADWYVAAVSLKPAP